MIFGVLTRVIPIPARSGDRLPRHPACSVFELQNDLAGILLNIPAHSANCRRADLRHFAAPTRPAKAYTAGIVLACSKFDASRRQAGEIAARQNDLFGTAPTIIGKARHNVPNGGTVRAGRASRNR
jgi:hypothetical protein